MKAAPIRFRTSGSTMTHPLGEQAQAMKAALEAELTVLEEKFGLSNFKVNLIGIALRAAQSVKPEEVPAEGGKAESVNQPLLEAAEKALAEWWLVKIPRGKVDDEMVNLKNQIDRIHSAAEKEGGKAECPICHDGRFTYCAYCGKEYPLDTVTAEQVSEHIRTCEKHPMRKLESVNQRLLEAAKNLAGKSVLWVSQHGYEMRINRIHLDELNAAIAAAEKENENG